MVSFLHMLIVEKDELYYRDLLLWEINTISIISKLNVNLRQITLLAL